jgi:hypothetical protein
MVGLRDAATLGPRPTVSRYLDDLKDVGSRPIRGLASAGCAGAVAEHHQKVVDADPWVSGVEGVDHSAQEPRQGRRLFDRQRQRDHQANRR